MVVHFHYFTAGEGEAGSWALKVTLFKKKKKEKTMAKVGLKG